MASTNGTTGKPGQAMPRRPVGGLPTPVVPVIPYGLFPEHRRKPAAPSPIQSPTTEKVVHDEPVATPAATPAAAPASPTAQPQQVLAEAEKTAVTGNQTTPPAVLPNEAAQPAEPEALTPPTTVAHTVHTTNGQLVTPRSGQSTKKGADTPVSRSSATQAEQSVASPTPTRRRPGPSFHAGSGTQQANRTSAPVADVFYEPIANHNHNKQPSMRYGGTALHQARASDGSLIFGALDSNASSPVPPGGEVQPPTSMPHAAEVPTAAPIFDGFGRPQIASPAVDGFPPGMFTQQPIFHHPHNHHGPPTPHSFHGSQSSVLPDDSYSNYPTANGHSAQSVQSGGPAQRHMATMSMDPQSGVHYPVANVPAFSQQQVETLRFLQSGVERGDFSDCNLELRLARAAPLLLPCHRFILARSPTLKRMLRDVPAGGHLLLEIQDQFMRVDCFHIALRTLYGWDLPDGPFLPYRPSETATESLDIALGYAAAASYIQLPYVYGKAIYYASHQLHLETIQKACQFALPTIVLALPGREMRANLFVPFALVDAIVAFMVHEMPADFILDVNAGDCGFNRLPPSSAAPASHNPRHAGPVVANGTTGFQRQLSDNRHEPTSNAHMPGRPRPSGNPRLSSIQFGDLSLVNGGFNNASNGFTNGARFPSAVDTVMSRILLNLPFFMLKRVLEHQALAEGSGSFDPNARLGLISAIVAEREARRFSVLNSGAPHLRDLKKKLETAPEPLVALTIEDFHVNSMGFKEEVFPGDVPYLVQTWINGSGRTHS